MQIMSSVASKEESRTFQCREVACTALKDGSSTALKKVKQSIPTSRFTDGQLRVNPVSSVTYTPFCLTLSGLF